METHDDLLEGLKSLWPCSDKDGQNAIKILQEQAKAFSNE